MKSKVRINILLQIAYEVIVMFLPFILSPYIARVLGANGLGQYSYTHSIATYFVLFSMLGIKNYGNREIAKSKNDSVLLNKTFSQILLVHVCFSVVLSVIYFLYVSCIRVDMKEYFYIQGIYVLSSLFDITWLYLGLEQFKINIIRNLTIRIGMVILTFIFVKAPSDLSKYVFIMSGGAMMGQLVMWLPLKKYVRFVRVSFTESVTHLKPLFVLFIPTIAVSVYKYMSKIMVGGLSNTTELGYYDCAEQLNSLPAVMIGAIGVVMLPRMANMLSLNEDQKFKEYIESSMRYFNLFSLFVASIIAGAANNFAPWFWGDEFAICSNMIILLSSTIPFITIANILRTQYLIPNSKDKEYVISIIGGAIANLLFNFILIPKMGAMGGIVGTIAAEFSVFAIQSYMVRKELDIVHYYKIVLPYILISAITILSMYIIGSFLSTNFTSIFIQCIAGSVIYFALAIVLLITRKDPILKSLKVIR